MSADPKRLEWIDAVKGASILLIVFYHTIIFCLDEQFLGDLYSHRILVILATVLVPLRVPLFFLVSGFLAASAIDRKSWGSVFHGRIANISWIYLVWFILQWITALLVFHLGNPDIMPRDPAFNLATLTHDFLTGESATWYLYALVLYFIFSKIIHHSKIILVGLAVVASIYADTFIESWNLRSIGQNIIFFVAGYAFKEQINSRFKAFSTPRFLATTLISLLLLGLASKFSLMRAPGFRMVLAFMMIFAAIDLLSLLSRYFKMTLLKRIGQNTLPVYVIHFILIQIIIQLIDTLNVYEPVGEQGVLGEAIIIILPFLLTALISIMCLTLHKWLMSGPGSILFTLPHRPSTGKLPARE
ncbi:acyltransferase family protein [Larsenimonas rhizosphaerae]|uniref:acyltransferase family protein n=1 Tax=Larsenimonas rhizosphaerae TaxID=2944682 RepID=UPI0020345AD4|nr:acyltransferase family protein [Larsenimonas rhizosphaerae]MCM2131698.1 acyltransferase family protein [Larsenimonas rhizosphaerae]